MINLSLVDQGSVFTFSLKLGNGIAPVAGDGVVFLFGPRAGSLDTVF